MRSSSLIVLGMLVTVLALGAGVIVLTVAIFDDTKLTSLPPVTHNATHIAQIAARRDPDVPDLPFPDNPDPSQCGIPVMWGNDNNRAYLTGVYQGELVQPEVLLYDSHSRFSIKASAPHGAEVEIVLFQSNPVADYYMVKIVGKDSPNEGWVPAPFLSFDPIEPLTSAETR